MENSKMKDKFIPTNNDLSYYPLLFLAMEETLKGDIIEMGCGHGSTALLHDYCQKNGRFLYSYEEKMEWFNKFTHLENGKHSLFFVKNWDDVKYLHELPAVVFIDHAPGERRKEDIVNFKDCGIIVCHDTEPAADHGYQMRQHFSLFKYVVEIKTNGAWATALSNEYDLTKWKGQTFGNYIVS